MASAASKKEKDNMILYIRVPKDLHTKIAAIAEKRGQTMAGAIRFILTKTLKAKAA